MCHVFGGIYTLCVFIWKLKKLRLLLSEDSPFGLKCDAFITIGGRSISKRMVITKKVSV